MAFSLFRLKNLLKTMSRSLKSTDFEVAQRALSCFALADAAHLAPLVSQAALKLLEAAKIVLPKAEEDWQFLMSQHLSDLETAVGWLLASDDHDNSLLALLLPLADAEWLQGVVPSPRWLAERLPPLLTAPKALRLAAFCLSDARAAQMIVTSAEAAAVAMRWQRGDAGGMPYTALTCGFSRVQGSLCPVCVGFSFIS